MGFPEETPEADESRRDEGEGVTRRSSDGGQGTEVGNERPEAGINDVSIDADVRAFLEEHGGFVPEEDLRDDPPEAVDMEKIRAFYRKELSLADEEWVAFLISDYRPWREAGNQVISEETDNNRE